MLTMLKLAFAGLGPLIWHWGIGVGAIILLVAAAELTTAIPLIGPWLEKVRKDILWVAVGIALLLIGEGIGARDMAHRSAAKALIIQSTVDEAVLDANGNPRQDKWDTNK